MERGAIERESRDVEINVRLRYAVTGRALWSRTLSTRSWLQGGLASRRRVGLTRRRLAEGLGRAPRECLILCVFLESSCLVWYEHDTNFEGGWHPGGW